MSWCELKPTTYDANGNTLTDAQGRSFTWDFENRLTQAVNPGVGTTTFKYDPFGRRVQKSGPLGTTNYVYDTTDIVEELDGVGGVLASYAPGQSIDQPLAELRSGTTTYYHADGIGSITSLTNSSATTTASYAYDAFGNLSASTGSLAIPSAIPRGSSIRKPGSPTTALVIMIPRSGDLSPKIHCISVEGISTFTSTYMPIR